MIVLKHLAREYNLNPYKLRKILRAEFGHHRRWQWEEFDNELKKINAFLVKRGENTSDSHENAQSTSSPPTKKTTAPPRKRSSKQPSAEASTTSKS